MATQQRAIKYAPRQTIKLVRGLKSDSESGFTLVEYGPYGLIDMDAPETLPAGSMMLLPFSTEQAVVERTIYRGQ